MSKKKISVENEEFNTFRALLLSIDFVKNWSQKCLMKI
ncbi:hypothetical protein BANRA_04256 [Escherichia coli]|nr:hypothetical protein BANRA_04256 [Escherichia coli]